MAYPESAVEDPPHGEGIGWCGGCKQDLQQGAQKPIEPAQEQAEVVAGSGEHGIDAVAVASFQVAISSISSPMELTGSPPQLVCA